MKKATSFLDIKRWRPIILGAAALLVMSGLYVLQIAWPGRLTPAEVATAAANSSLSSILHNPLNLLYKIVDFAWLQTPLTQTVSARLASVSLALITAVVFYFLAKRWHGRTSATYAVIVFATSTWLLHSGREGGGQIMLLLVPLSLLLLASWLNTTKQHSKALLLFALVSSLALFTPGALWLVIAVGVLLGSILGDHVKHASIGSKLSAASIFLVTAIGLIYTFVQNAALIRSWLGVPASFDPLLTMLKQWIGSLTYLVARGPDMSGAWLAHTPVLDVATTVLLLFGIFLYRKHLGSLRTQLLIVFFLIGSILVALNGSIALGYLVGIAYLVVATGLAYFQHRWFKTFPLNPLARGLAFTLVILLVASIVTFHTQRYFVAWQRSPATQKIFQESSVLRSDLIQ